MSFLNIKAIIEKNLNFTVFNKLYRSRNNRALFFQIKNQLAFVGWVVINIQICLFAFGVTSKDLHSFQTFVAGVWDFSRITKKQKFQN